ncbi:hypothetical protein ACLB2K_041462 [Fragaria x ananassa]
MPRIWHNYPVTGDHSGQDSTGEPFMGIQRVKVQQQSTCQTHSPAAKHLQMGGVPQRITDSPTLGTEATSPKHWPIKQAQTPKRGAKTGLKDSTSRLRHRDK